jgi:hypothetical protein
MMDPRRRAAFGKAAVDAGTPDRGKNDNRTDAIDVVANILHWLRSIDEPDPAAILSSAATHFLVERDESQYEVALTSEGFRLRDTETLEMRPEVWAARHRAQQACQDINEGKPISKAAKPDRILADQPRWVPVEHDEGVFYVESAKERIGPFSREEALTEAARLNAQAGIRRE